MAALAHMSTSQFYAIYQEEFNQTPKASLIEARMEYAKYLLRNNSLKISQIAKMIGYQNEYHFIRHFKKGLEQLQDNIESPFRKIIFDRNKRFCHVF